MENNQKEANRGSRLFLRTLGILLIASLIINFFLWNKKKQIEYRLQTRIDTLETANNAMETDVKSRVAELEVFRGKNDSLNKIIDEGVQKISVLEKEIHVLQKQAKGNAAKKQELETKIAAMNRLTEEYLERIDQLMTENHLLKKDNEDLTRNLYTAMGEKTELQNKVTVASELKVEYTKITPMKKKLLSEKFSETSMAKKVVQLNTCFSILENKVALPGKKTVYLRIVAPDGKVVGNPAANSGKFTTTNGEEMQYTLSKEIDFSGSKQELCLNYEEPDKGNFSPGNYTVEIYTDGTLSSTLGMTLK